MALGATVGPPIGAACGDGATAGSNTAAGTDGADNSAISADWEERKGLHVKMSRFWKKSEIQLLCVELFLDNRYFKSLAKVRSCRHNDCNVNMCSIISHLESVLQLTGFCYIQS